MLAYAPPPALPFQTVPDAEPDGSRAAGSQPPYKAAPGAPAWLRGRSHEIAAVDCQHYMYEAYALEGQFLARYVMLPEGQEAFREIEQVFLFTSDPGKKPKEIKPDQIQFNPQSAEWKGKTWILVDRRDLKRP